MQFSRYHASQIFERAPSRNSEKNSQFIPNWKCQIRQRLGILIICSVYPFTTQLIFKNVSQRFYTFHANSVRGTIKTFFWDIFFKVMRYHLWYWKAGVIHVVLRYDFRKLIPTLALAGLAQAAWPLTGQCDGKESVLSSIENVRE